MKFKYKFKLIVKRTRKVKRKTIGSISGFMPIRMLIKNRRAINAVISNLILIAAVIVVGFVALGYARSTSISYQEQYGQTVSSDINQLKEKLVFEYVSYNATGYGPTNGSVTVYFMNAGSINDITIKSSKISNSSWSTTFSCIGQTNFLNATKTSAFDIGEEGYFTQPLNTTLVSGMSYTVTILTGRDSTFVYNFAS